VLRFLSRFLGAKRPRSEGLKISVTVERGTKDTQPRAAWPPSKGDTSELLKIPNRESHPDRDFPQRDPVGVLANPCRAICTCADFVTHRSSFASDDVRRCCYHLASFYCGYESFELVDELLRAASDTAGVPLNLRLEEIGETATILAEVDDDRVLVVTRKRRKKDGSALFTGDPVSNIYSRSRRAWLFNGGKEVPAARAIKGRIAEVF
jgi:hypothetical protein